MPSIGTDSAPFGGVIQSKSLKVEKTNKKLSIGSVWLPLGGYGAADNSAQRELFVGKNGDGFTSHLGRQWREHTKKRDGN